MGFQSSNPPASSDAIALGSATRFNRSTVEERASTDDRWFQLPPKLWGHFSRPVAWPTSRRTEKILIPTTMISPSPRRSQSLPKQVVDRALGDGDDGVGDNDDDVNEVICSEIFETARYHVRLIPPSLIDRFQIVDQLPLAHRPPCSHTSQRPTTSSTVATPRGKKYPRKNVSSRSPLHRKLQQHSTTLLQTPTVDDRSCAYIG